MDNAESPAWGPPLSGIAAVALAGFLMAAACAAVGDIPGRILTGLAATGLLVFAAGSLKARPRLTVSTDGLTYRGWFRRRVLTRADIALIRITEFRRLGRPVRLLEIDTTDDELLVLSRWDVGGDPVAVLDALTAAGYSAPGPRRT